MERVCVVFVHIGSPWTRQLNEHLVYMQEQGQLSQLRDKWWEHEALCEVSRAMVKQAPEATPR